LSQFDRLAASTIENKRQMQLKTGYHQK
jgi:hypothetical protein